MKKLLTLALLFGTMTSYADTCFSRYVSVVDGGFYSGELCAVDVRIEGKDYISFKEPYIKTHGVIRTKRLPIASYGGGDSVYCHSLGYNFVAYRVSDSRLFGKKAVVKVSAEQVEVTSPENNLILTSLSCTTNPDKVY